MSFNDGGEYNACNGLENFIVSPETYDDTSTLPLDSLPLDSTVASNGENAKNVANNLSMASKLLQRAQDALSSNRSLGSGTGATIKLNDLTQTSPFESEAETAILQALEDRDPNTTPKSGFAAKQQNLLPMVPDDVSHAFEDEPSSQRTMGTSSGARSRAKPPDPIPRDTNDVEQQLFGITTALRAIHAENMEHVESLEHDTVGGAPSLGGGTIPLSAADELAQNAGILFRRNVPRTADNDLGIIMEVPENVERRTNEDESIGINSASSSNAKKNWGKLRGSMLHSKKSNIETLHEADEEIDPEMGEAASVASGGSRSNRTTHTKPAPRHTYNRFFGHLHRPHVGKAMRNAAKLATTEVSNDLHIFRAFFRPRHATMFAYCKSVLFYFIIPALSIAAVLFYFVDNPHTGRQSHRTDAAKPKNGSISWWIIFICVRQVVTLSFALAFQALFIDFFALRTRITLRLCGPVVTLLIVQSKGWPFTVCCWGILDLITLTGSGPFAHHWLYFQPWIGLFNTDNPSGGFVASHTNYRIIAMLVIVSFVVAIKRVVIGLYLGRRTFANYSRQLTQVMHNMFLVSEVATLAKSLTTTKGSRYQVTNSNAEAVFGWRDRCVSEDEPSETENGEQRNDTGAPTANGPYLFDSSRRSLIKQALEDWEEPGREASLPATISVSAILQFRQALAFMSNDFPFSVSFGLANTRDACIQSSQLVYDDLVIPGDEALKFETLSVLAKDSEGAIDHKKLKDLIRLFRPDRDGRLSKIDFIKSVDNVYKSIRFLRASVAAAAKIDCAFESMFNVVFYVVVTCVALSILGFNPLTIFLSLSGVIVSFSFIIGTASAYFFQGVLFILVRRPYDIGDRIHVSNVETDTNSNGSAYWVVDDITLFTTTVIYLPTNERATYSNGSLALSRIINANRSPKAVIAVFLRFGVDVPYEKVTVFKNVVEQFVKARPREWLALCCFRASNVELDQGFIEYVIVVQHRELWQNIGSIMDSKADLSSFCLEVMKKMDMGYTSPSLPVALTVTHPEGSTQLSDASNRNDEQSFGMARSIANLFPQR